MKTKVVIILFCICLAWTSSSALQFTASVKEVIREDAGSNVTLKCWTRDQNISLILLMQISKVDKDGTRTTLVELFNGGKPTFADSTLSNRAETSGSLNVLQEANLTLTFVHPESSDKGNYECVMSFLDLQHSPDTDHASTSFSVVDFASLRQEFLDLQQEVELVQNRNCSCNAAKEEVVAFTVRVFSITDQLNLPGGNSGIPFNVVELDTHTTVDVGRGVITVPVTGIYSLQLTLAGVSELQTHILVNNVIKATLEVQPNQSGSVSYVTHLIKGQEVSVSYQQQSTIKPNLCFLSGHLIR